MEAGRIRTDSDRTVEARADEALIEGLRRHDREAVLELVERWSDSMLTTARFDFAPAPAGAGVLRYRVGPAREVE